jgi:hypothetical protein
MRKELPQDRRLWRLGDLFWLLAHRGRGSARLGDDSYALGLAAAVIAELVAQPAAAAGEFGVLSPDLVLGPVMADMQAAAKEDIVRPVRPWVDWLAQERHRRTEATVIARLSAAGALRLQHRRAVPADQWVASAPLTLLMATLGGSNPESDAVRVLAGLCLSCGLTGEFADHGGDHMVALGRLARRASPPLRAVLTALDDSLHALAVRRP